MREVRDRVSLRTRIGLLAAVMVGLAAAGVSAAAFYVVRNSMYRDLDSQLIHRAVFVVDSGLLANPDHLPAAALYGEDIRVGLLSSQHQMRIPNGSRPPPVGDPELDVAAARCARGTTSGCSRCRPAAIPHWCWPSR
jgi:two-component system, OmpR family, sensor histidine kinase MprB